MPAPNTSHYAKRLENYRDLGLSRCGTCKNMRPIYARDLCSKCYYKCARLKRASKCQHAGVKPHYSKGLCRECYLMVYYQNRKKNRQDFKEDVELISANAV